MHSMPRNPVLIKLFRFAKLSENAGFGIDKMLTWEKLTHNSVEFSSDVVCSTVTYFRTKNIMDLQNVLENVLENVPENVPVNVPENRKKIIVSLIKENKTITMDEMSVLCKVNVKTIKRDIEYLKQKGLITRIGPDKGGYWKVNDAVNTESDS